jgi:hypothetical protein
MVDLLQELTPTELIFISTHDLRERESVARGKTQFSGDYLSKSFRLHATGLSADTSPRKDDQLTLQGAAHQAGWESERMILATNLTSDVVAHISWP